MTTPKKNWFERHQGFITFSGYLATVIIGGISLYNSNSKSTDALQLSKNQFKYEIKKDFLNSIEVAKSEREAKIKFRHQDSLNKHQDSINGEQLKTFKSQTLTAKEQLSYFKKQTRIAETQLKNAESIYQQQLDENKPSITVQDFVIDSTDKPNIHLKYHFLNSGKREAIIKKLTIFMWNSKSSFLSPIKTQIDGDSLLPGAESDGMVTISNRLILNQDTYVMYQFYYNDKVKKDMLVYRQYGSFWSFKPVIIAQIDEIHKELFLQEIKRAEIHNKSKYLDY